MEIRKSKEEDVRRIMEIYAHAREFMAQTGNPNQWGPTCWPLEALIREDIAAGNSYVLVHDGKTAAVFYYRVGDDPTYAVIEDGSWKDGSPYGVVHRIASDGSIKGAGKFCISWCYEQCGHLRIDTHPDNKVMQKALKALGFSYCGIIYVEEDDNPRLAFEKSAQSDSASR